MRGNAGSSSGAPKSGVPARAAFAKTQIWPQYTYGILLLYHRPGAYANHFRGISFVIFLLLGYSLIPLNIFRFPGSGFTALYGWTKGISKENKTCFLFRNPFYGIYRKANMCYNDGDGARTQDKKG